MRISSEGSGQFGPAVFDSTPGGPNAGGSTRFDRDDVFLAKYDSQGDLLWDRQLGTSKDDNYPSTAVDAAGNVLGVHRYILGE